MQSLQSAGISFLSAVVALGSMTGCAGDQVDERATQHIEQIESTHGGSAYDALTAIEADFALEFGALTMNAKMLFTPSVGKARMDVEGVGTMIFDGESVWVSPSDAQIPGPPARFHVLTWPYFVAAPFKLNDPGTNHSSTEEMEVSSPLDIRSGTKITFDAGVGDAPDDWYIAFSDDQGRLDALAYIVTATKSKEAAESSPSIIIYADFVEIDGVTISANWHFHHWHPETGIGAQKAGAKLSNIRFVTPPADAFVKPEDAVESTLPALASGS